MFIKQVSVFVENENGKLDFVVYSKEIENLEDISDAEREELISLGKTAEKISS